MPFRKWLFTLLRHRNSDSWHAGIVILRLVPSGEEIVEFPLEIDNGLHPTSSEASGQSTSPSQRHLCKTQKIVFHLHFAVLIYLIIYSLETSMAELRAYLICPKLGSTQQHLQGALLYHLPR